VRDADGHGGLAHAARADDGDESIGAQIGSDDANRVVTTHHA